MARLGVVDDQDRPRVLPIAYARVGDELWSAVDHKPKRVEGRELARLRWLRRQPEAAVTVDSYEDDWSRLGWVQLLGRVAVIDEPGAEVTAALAAKYRQYAERPPAGPFLRLAVERTVCWRAGG